MKAVDWKSVICAKNHTFDFTKQGYLNLLTRPSNSPYKKELFEARHKMIMKSGLYAPMHEWIAKAIKEHVNDSSNNCLILDAGCGEGSHLQKVMDECMDPAITGVGLDISKQGILMASKRYKNSFWIVGDVARSPFKSKSFHVILTILSPANYMEFKRLLIQDGLVMKVIPRPHYLKELREELFDNNRKKAYQHGKTVSLFKEHLQLLEAFELRYTKKLGKAELHDIVQMTPLAWSADSERIKTYVNQDSAEITVDVEILVGIKKRAE
jgi:23S rRNA (guanine745-N1)-methyltransferase